MEYFQSFVILMFLFVHGSDQASTPHSKEYVAAVVEFHRNSDITREAVEHNAKHYVKFIKEAGEKGADVVVFPEETLTPDIKVALVLPSSEHASPCLHRDRYDPVLVDISCAARKARIYAVINVYEILDCTVPQEFEDCPEKKVFYFSVNIVFDRSGDIIDMYRKINLLTDPGLTASFDEGAHGVFDTDFGVRFGHFICSDTFFQNPALTILDDTDIQDVIIPTRWYNELPFVISVSYYLSFAFVNNINLLVAGANLVSHKTSGTGVYSGKAGALVNFITGEETSRLFVTKVPKRPGHPLGPTTGPIFGTVEQKNGLILAQDPSISSLHWSQLVQENSNQAMSMSSGDFSCSFAVKLKSTETEDVTEKYRYRAVAFDGVMDAYGVSTFGNRYCAIVACLDENLDSCGKRFPNSKPGNTNPFEKLRISTQFPAPIFNASLSAPNSQTYPRTVLDTLLPLQPDEYRYSTSEDDGALFIEMSLSNHSAALLTFGVWGRNFDRDGQEITS